MPVALSEAVPLEIWVDTSGCTCDITIHGLGSVMLARHILVEGVKTTLDGRDNMVFKLLEIVLDIDQIGSMCVLFRQLFVESVPNASLKDIWIVGCGRPATHPIEAGCMLTEKLDLFLRVVSC